MTTKEIERGRGTHFLSRAAGRTSQDTGRNRAREGHSHPVGRSGKDKSKLLKEIDRARDTHILSSAGTSQDTKWNRASKGLTPYQKQRNGLVRTPKKSR